MAGKLRLTLQTDTDGTGQLFVEASSDGFAGQSSAWFDLQGLAKFALTLEAFPLPTDDPPFLEGGFWSKEERGKIEQRHVGLRFRQIDRRGTIGIHVYLAAPVHQGESLERQGLASFEIQTDYAELQRFAHEFNRLATGDAEEACLTSGVSAE